MPTINESVEIYYFAKNLLTGGGKTGDAANHTLRLSRDGILSAFTASPTPVEVSNTYFKGLYAVTVPAIDNDSVSMALGGTSSTSGVEIFPTVWVNDQASLANIYAALQTQITNTGGDWREGTISIVRGNDYDGVAQAKIGRDFVDEENDLRTWTCTMTWRRYGRPDTETPIFAQTVTPTLVSGSTYRVDFSPLKAQTEDMIPVRNGYYYDVTFIAPGGTRSTRELGNIIVARNATI